jgi:hypothetical protein
MQSAYLAAAKVMVVLDIRPCGAAGDFASIGWVVEVSLTKQLCDLHLKHHPHRLLHYGLTKEHADQICLVVTLGEGPAPILHRAASIQRIIHPTLMASSRRPWRQRVWNKPMSATLDGLPDRRQR